MYCLNSFCFSHFGKFLELVGGMILPMNSKFLVHVNCRLVLFVNKAMDPVQVVASVLLIFM